MDNITLFFYMAEALPLCIYTALSYPFLCCWTPGLAPWCSTVLSHAVPLMSQYRCDDLESSRQVPRRHTDEPNKIKMIDLA